MFQENVIIVMEKVIEHQIMEKMATEKQKEFNKETMKKLKQRYSFKQLNKMSSYIDWEKEEIKAPEGGWSKESDKENSLYYFLRGFTD